jgi:hypothetical protein
MFVCLCPSIAGISDYFKTEELADIKNKLIENRLELSV